MSNDMYYLHQNLVEDHLDDLGNEYYCSVCGYSHNDNINAFECCSHYKMINTLSGIENDVINIDSSLSYEYN